MKCMHKGTQVVFIVRYIMDTSGIYCTVYYGHEWYLLYGILSTQVVFIVRYIMDTFLYIS